jgi:hypothetical protein
MVVISASGKKHSRITVPCRYFKSQKVAIKSERALKVADG